jgi:hypothetical protein
MEPKGSLPYLQEPATCPYPEPDQSRPCPPFHLLKIHFNIIPPSMPRPSKWCLSLRSHHQNPVCTSVVRHTCHIPHQSFDLITCIIFGEEYRSYSYLLCNVFRSHVTSFLRGLNMLLSTVEHSWPTFLPQHEWPSFTHIQSGSTIIVKPRHYDSQNVKNIVHA